MVGFDDGYNVGSFEGYLVGLLLTAVGFSVPTGLEVGL